MIIGLVFSISLKPLCMTIEKVTKIWSSLVKKHWHYYVFTTIFYKTVSYIRYISMHTLNWLKDVLQSRVKTRPKLENFGLVAKRSTIRSRPLCVIMFCSYIFTMTAACFCLWICLHSICPLKNIYCSQFTSTIDPGGQTLDFIC